MANYLVTGGAGFIGSHLVTNLVDRNHSVRVLDDFSSGKRANLQPVADRIDLHEGDMRNPEVCRAACDGIDVVFHLAAIPSVPKSVETPEASHNANINGTFNVLTAARDGKCRRVVYAASSSAYGDTDVSPKHEGLRPIPLSPYAVQKLTGELYCKAFTECYGLETVAIRYFNVFGPRQDPASQYAAAIPAFVTAILRDTSPTVYGDGEQTRDFTFVDNVVHGNVLAAEAERTDGQAVNVACGESISVNRVIARINELLGTNVQPNHVEPRAGDVRHSTASIDLARTLFGFEPTVRFEEGLSRAIEYYQSIAR
jgi:UDP-glucose 4-epimerase